MRQATQSKQRDLLRESPENLAAAYLAAAQVAELDPNFPAAADRKARADYYRREAERIKREAMR